MTDPEVQLIAEYVACSECGCPYDWRTAIAAATAERAAKDRLVKAVGEVAAPIVGPAGQHGHRWLARSPEGALPLAVFGLTEDEARTAYAQSWAAWAKLLDGSPPGTGFGSQDPSDEAQQRPLRGSTPPLVPGGHDYEDVDLCAILGHDPYTDEPNHCGRCDLQLIDGSSPAIGVDPSEKSRGDSDA